MKKTPQNFFLIFVLFTTLLIGASSFSTKNSDLPEFKIVFKNTTTGVKLTGQKGTAFKELSFTTKENIPQRIDEYGVTVEESKLNGKDENLADFEFTVTRTTKGFSLVGKKGTAWTKLDFDITKKDGEAVVDQLGVTVK